MSDKVNHNCKSHDLFAMVLGGFAAVLLMTSPFQVDTSGPYPFYKGALIFPVICLLLMIIASIPSAIRLLKANPAASWHLDGGGLPGKPLAMLVLLVGFIGGLHAVGLEISVFLFSSIALYILGHRSPARFIGIPLVLTLILYLTFKYTLDVFFPVPLLMEWLGGITRHAPTIV